MGYINIAQKKQISEQTVLFSSVAKWVLLASLIGAVVGLTTTAFLKLLNFSIGAVSQNAYYFVIIPVVLAVNALIMHYVFPKDRIDSTNKVIKSIHQSKDVSIKSGIKAFFLPILTIASGGSAGKEAPCADVGAASGSFFGRFLKLNKDDRKKFMICGISAGFASVFGTPIAGAIFGVEVLYVGGLLYEVLLPSFIAGIIGYQVSSHLGITYFSHTINFMPKFTESFFLTIILAGIVFGLLSLFLIEFFKYSKKISAGIKIWFPIKAFLAGIVIVALVFLFSKDYLGLGTNVIESSLQGGFVIWYAFLLKIVFTSLTLGFGGSGGLVTPIFFIGATAGAAFGHLLGLDVATFAAIGLICLFAGATNAPISASILSIELFGPLMAPYAAVACIISFLMTGHRSIYPAQILRITKSSALKITGKNLGSTKVKVDVRNDRALKRALKIAEKNQEIKGKLKKDMQKYRKDLSK